MATRSTVMTRVATGALALLVLMACAAMAVLSTRSRRSAEHDVRVNNELRAIDGLRISLSRYGRVSALAYIAQLPQYERAQAREEVELLGRIAAAESAITDPTQRALIDKADLQIRDYLVARKEIEERRGSDRELVLTAVPAVEAALDTLHEASRNGFDAVSAAERQLARDEALENILGTSVAALLLAGFAIIVVTVRRDVFAPLLALKNGIDRFAGGDLKARVDPIGPDELQRTAESFNGMAAKLERRREDGLTFLAGVAHDLRNPLAAMRMGIYFLVRATPGDKKQKTIQLLDRQVTQLERMVGDFLDATRIEGGHLELELEQTDLRGLAQEAVELYRASTNDHRILLYTPDSPVEVRCDSARIGQVLNNLVSNAIKYSPGGGDVGVSLTATDDEAIIAVDDSGIGISPADMEHIFEPFHRTGASRETAPGVGLGLSVARQIIEAHGGRIEVDSAVGIGSTFRVRLPLAERAAAQTPAYHS